MLYDLEYELSYSLPSVGNEVKRLVKSVAWNPKNEQRKAILERHITTR